MKGEFIMGIVYYLVSLICAWYAWNHYAMLYLEREIPDLFERSMFAERLAVNFRTGNKPFGIVEWIRFFMWPYGIIQRTTFMVKELKLYKLETSK